MHAKYFAWQKYAAYAQKHTMLARNTEANLASWILRSQSKNEISVAFFKLKNSQFDWWSYEYGFMIFKNKKP